MKGVEESQFNGRIANTGYKMADALPASLLDEDVTIIWRRPVMTKGTHWDRLAHEAVSLEPREERATES